MPRSRTLGEPTRPPGAVLGGARRGLRAVGRPRLAGRARRRPNTACGAARSAGRVRRSRLPRRRCGRRQYTRARTWRQAVRSRARGDGWRRGGQSCRGLDAIRDVGRSDRVEPALTVVLSGERFDAALTAIADFVDLKSPYTLGHARAVADLAAAAASSDCPWPSPHAAARGAGARSGPAGCVELDLGQAGAAWPGRMGAGPASSLYHRADAAPIPGARSAWCYRRPASGAA